MAKIVSILQETVDQITERQGRQLDVLYARTQEQHQEMVSLRQRMTSLEGRLNEAAVALLQRQGL